MQHLGFSTTWLREYTRRNILLCTLLAFSVLNLESALGSTTAPSDAANFRQAFPCLPESRAGTATSRAQEKMAH